MADIIGALVSAGVLILWIYGISDVITTEAALVQHLPKLVWLLIVVLLSDLGSLLWLAFGRPRIWHRRAQDPTRRARYEDGPPGGSPASGGTRPARNPIVQYREEQALLRLRAEQVNRREAGARAPRARRQLILGACAWRTSHRHIGRRVPLPRPS